MEEAVKIDQSASEEQVFTNILNTAKAIINKNKDFIKDIIKKALPTVSGDKIDSMINDALRLDFSNEKKFKKFTKEYKDIIDEVKSKYGL